MTVHAGDRPSPLDVYGQLRARIAELLADAPGERPVPACPGWDVGDVLCHLVGLAEDVAAADVDGFATGSWTAAHIDRHRGAAVGELLGRWQEVSERLPDALPSVDHRVPGITSVGIAMAFDALAHEQDLRSALHLGLVPTDGALLLMSDIALSGLHERRRDAATLLIVRLEDGTAFDAGGEGPERELRTTRLEVWRSLSGRRTRTEVAAMDWSGPPPDDLERTWVHPAFDWPEVPVGA